MGRAVRILLVDDDDQVLSLMEHMLQDHGYVVDAVATPSAAWSLLRTRQYDLALIDARLGDGDEGSGIEIADEAKSRGIQVVIVTGHGLHFRRALQGHQYLLKPIRPDELVRAVAIYVGPPETAG